jgi:hypothetical protein
MSTADKKPNPKKKTVPKVVRDLAWAKWIGDDIAKTKCMCCGLNEIKMNSFHCGHIMAEVNGGKTTVDNLRPICAACNLSMGAENMDDFKARCGFASVSSTRAKAPEFDDESETPVVWFDGILSKRTPKYLVAPDPPPTIVNGRTYHIIDVAMSGRIHNELKGKYSICKPGVYKRT